MNSGRLCVDRLGTHVGMILGHQSTLLPKTLVTAFQSVNKTGAEDARISGDARESYGYKRATIKDSLILV